MSWTRYDANGQPMFSATSLYPGLRSIQTFTANGTYTTPVGVRAIIVEAVGGGGGGGSALVATVANVSVGSGGAGGAYAKKYIASPNTTYAVVIGLGGAGGAGTANGTAGSNTTFGATVLICQGGPGGLANVNAVTTLFQPGGIGAVATGGDYNVTGEHGGWAYRLGANNTSAISGRGGSSPFGRGGNERSLSVSTGGVGTAGDGKGSGGSGGVANTAAAFAGGAGTDGFLIVYEYQ